MNLKNIITEEINNTLNDKYLSELSGLTSQLMNQIKSHQTTSGDLSRFNNNLLSFCTSCIQIMGGDINNVGDSGYNGYSSPKSNQKLKNGKYFSPSSYLQSLGFKSIDMLNNVETDVVNAYRDTNQKFKDYFGLDNGSAPSPRIKNIPQNNTNNAQDLKSLYTSHYSNLCSEYNIVQNVHGSMPLQTNIINKLEEIRINLIQ